MSEIVSQCFAVEWKDAEDHAWHNQREFETFEMAFQAYNEFLARCYHDHGTCRSDRYRIVKHTRTVVS